MFHRTAGLGVTLIASVLAAQPVPATAAKPVGTDVEITVTVEPGTQTADGDWCIGTGRSDVTARVVEVANGVDITEGWLVWQECERPPLRGLPKEDCEAGRPAHWANVSMIDLSFDKTISVGPLVPVLGFRVEFEPERHRGLEEGETSASFNLDTTCGPLP